ncbi:GntR family transcriptional regulator [Streptomyces sp. SID9727]|uniref:GntR family transcriptional regulator n=1 Tax=Streptomyces sp. SID9727 TaxID=2706114 RepID=UPI0013C74687|nr:GntR family transcriptional regulator [Streptomyces sp. SID9727]NEC67365.1 GntR family transcriptional regulator [Streptomyces sp. SID9727]
MPADARYRGIAADIIRRIEAGEWPAGAPLPSRRALAAEYGVGGRTDRPPGLRSAARHAHP